MKEIINKFLSPIGLEVQKKRNRNRVLRTTLREAYNHLNTVNFHPNTIIDVGVATGTPELYESFPDAYFFLVEPIKSFESDIKSILKKYNGSYVLAAAGAKSGSAEFNVHDYHLGGSSLLEETMGKKADGRKVNVPIITLDEEVERKKFLPPFLLKIDVQGAELEVLKGSIKVLRDTEVVVLEVSMFEFMIDSPQFYDIIHYMKTINFVAYDMILGWNRPLDNALGQVDIIFVKENSSFRKSHAYSEKVEIK